MCGTYTVTVPCSPHSTTKEPDNSTADCSTQTITYVVIDSHSNIKGTLGPKVSKPHDSGVVMPNSLRLSRTKYVQSSSKRYRRLKHPCLTKAYC